MNMPFLSGLEKAGQFTIEKKFNQGEKLTF